MTKAIYPLLLVLAVSTAQAGNLFYLGSYYSLHVRNQYYADLAGAKRNGHMVAVRTMVVFGKSFMDDGVGPVTYHIATNIIDCKSQTIEMPTIDEYNAKNQLVKHYSAPADYPNEFRPIDGPDKVLADKICQ